MDPEFEIHDKNARPEESIFSRLLAIIGFRPSGLDEFARRIVSSFHPAILVDSPSGSQWFATLDAVNPEDNEVAVLVRLSRHRQQNPKEVRWGTISLGQRNRQLFAEPFTAGPSEESDLLLQYSFPYGLSMEKNVDLFREFARNELGRLRSKQKLAELTTDQPETKKKKTNRK